MFLVGRRISLSWMMHGQTWVYMSLPSFPGQVSVNRRSLTIGSGKWPLNTIVPRSSFLAGPFTVRGQGEVLRPRMNFLTLLLLGLAIQTHGLVLHGRRAKDSRN